MKDKYKFKISFSCTLKPVVSTEKDKYLSVASLQQLKQFLPEVDTEKNYDLLPVAFNACVINRVNKNGDVIDTDTALAIYKYFISKPIDIEHNRANVVGVILKAGFSEFGTDKPLTEEEVKGMTKPFNLTLGGVLWKAVNSRLTDLVEDSGDPSSDGYLSISASWELGFTDFHLVVLEGTEKNIEKGKLISDPEEVEKLAPTLRANGGSGQVASDKFLYRKPVNDVLPMGIGVTESPAAEVKGITTPEAKDSEKEEKEENVEEVTSQVQEPNVKENSTIIMKITNVKDITDDLLKQVKASVVSDFIEEQLKEADKKFSAEKQEKDKALEQVKANAEELKKTKEDLTKLSEELNKLKTSLAEREETETFNQRMAEFDSTYELNDEDRKVISAAIKGMKAEAYAEYQKSMEVLLKSKNKEAIKKATEAQAKAKEEKEKEDKKALEAKASEKKDDVKTTVDGVVTNAKVETPSVPSTPPQGKQTMREKYAKAFSAENWKISLK